MKKPVGILRFDEDYKNLLFMQLSERREKYVFNLSYVTAQVSFTPLIHHRMKKPYTYCATTIIDMNLLFTSRTLVFVVDLSLILKPKTTTNINIVNI